MPTRPPKRDIAQLDIEEILSGDALAQSHPGVMQFRREVIKALCHGTNVAMNVAVLPPDELGSRIVAVANSIIERTEQ